MLLLYLDRVAGHFDLSVKYHILLELVSRLTALALTSRASLPTILEFGSAAAHPRKET